jgi:hypothetical protein
VKPRPDAKLKTLPDAVQAALYALYQKKSGEECLVWLEQNHGVKSSTGALSNFAGWYPFSRPLEMVDARAKAVEAQLKADPNLHFNAEQVSAAGQIAFEQIALQLQDVKGFINLSKLRLKQRELELNLEKFRQTVKSDIDKGLDALHAEIKGNAQALQLFEKFKAAILASTEGKS